MTKLRLFTFMALSVLTSFAQSNKVSQLFYNGSLLQYVCLAPANVATTSVSIAAGTLTSIAVTSNVATVTVTGTTGLWVGAMVNVSGSATTALNGRFSITSVASLGAGTTYTYAVTVANGTYTDAALTINTSAPNLNSAVWSIQVLHYNGSSVLDNVHFAGPGTSQSFTEVCANRANFN